MYMYVCMELCGMPTLPTYRVWGILIVPAACLEICHYNFIFIARCFIITRWLVEIMSVKNVGVPSEGIRKTFKQQINNAAAVETGFCFWKSSEEQKRSKSLLAKCTHTRAKTMGACVIKLQQIWRLANEDHKSELLFITKPLCTCVLGCITMLKPMQLTSA